MDLFDHIEKKHANEKLDLLNKQNRCEYCYKFLNNRSNLRRHIKTCKAGNSSKNNYIKEISQLQETNKHLKELYDKDVNYYKNLYEKEKNYNEEIINKNNIEINFLKNIINNFNNKT